MSLVAIYTIYFASLGFPLWMYFAQMRYNQSISELVNLFLWLGSFLGIFVWRVIYGSRYPDSARSIRIVMRISLVILIWILIRMSVPIVT